MIIGIAKEYLLRASKATIKYYAETRALEDQDLYIAKVYANGRPKDNYSFILVDITGVVAPTV